MADLAPQRGKLLTITLFTVTLATLVAAPYETYIGLENILGGGRSIALGLMP